MKKKFSNADMYKSIEALGKRKINMLYLLIVGYPTETEKDFDDTLELLRRSVAYKRYVEVRCNIAMLLPNTELYDEFYLHHDDDHLWKTQTTDGVLTYRVRYERWKKINMLVENLGLTSDKRIKQLEKAILRNLEKEDSRVI
tara:strand:- start:325 stop:750 length:426 start_codon:yes stop_codon:yes gene_type:complete